MGTRSSNEWVAWVNPLRPSDTYMRQNIKGSSEQTSLISVETIIFHFNNMHLNIPYAKWRQ